jgi:hypothetical protein
MYAVVEETYTFFDRASDGMDHDTQFAIVHMNGDRVHWCFWRSVAQIVVDALNHGAIGDFK